MHFVIFIAPLVNNIKKLPIIFRKFCGALVRNLVKTLYPFKSISIPKRGKKPSLLAKKLFENRYTDMIVQIPSPFAWVGINFILLHFTNTKPLKTWKNKGRNAERSARR